VSAGRRPQVERDDDRCCVELPPTLVLVVEDNPGDFALVEDALASAPGIEHFEVLGAETLKQALVAARTSAPDIVLLDLDLPDARGLAGLHALLDVVPGLPVVVLTGNGDDALGRRALRAGAQDYLLKGEVKPSQLHRALRYAASRQAMTEALRESEARFHSLFAEAPVPLRCLAIDGTVIGVNRAFGELTGYSPERLLGMNVMELTHPEDRVAELDVLRGLASSQAPGDDYAAGYEQRVVRADGTLRHVRVSVSAVRDASGAPAYTNAVVHDVTDRVMAEAEVEASEERFRSLVRGVSDVISLHNADGTIAYMSPSGTRLLGLGADHTVQELWPYVHPDDTARLAESFAAWTRGEGQPVQYRLRRDNGEWVHCESLGVNLLDNPAVAGVVVTTRDISERKKAMDDLAYQAVHDCLTGLPNRTLFLDRLTHALDRRARSGASLAVLYLDLDNFKFINDSYGHHAGDEVLVAVSRVLQATIRPGDTIARLGGDEFAVVCEDVEDVDAARVLAERLAGVLRTAFDVRGHMVHIATSIGIAFAAPGDDTTADDLLRDADVALYRAKDKGRSRAEVFDDELRGRALRRVELEEALREAMAAGQFSVHYQPQVAVATGGVVGFEALLRWHHPRFGDVTPSEFVPIAESTGLIRPIGRWVLDEAAGQLAAWRRDHPELGITVAVNLSALQLSDDALVDTVQEVVSRHGVDPSSLCLEITESVVMDDASASVETLRRLKALGVRLAIDDFGTGYSSLAYLKRFPVDYLKVDRVFVAGLGRDPEDTVIVASVIDLASRLGLEVVAEGVESESQLQELAELGCAYAQGFLWSAPQPADVATRHMGVIDIRSAVAVDRREPAPAGGHRDRQDGSVDEIVSVLAHELRTPITVIRGFAETLGEIIRDGHVDVLERALNAITRQTNGMESVIASLGDVRAIDSGSLRLSTEPVDLRHAVAEVLADLRGVADGHELVLAVEEDVETVVSVDVNRLRQILVNLVTNAVRHSPPGAPIRLSMGRAESAVAVQVVDCGPGIPAHRLGELFRKFSRLDRTGKGTGLGLYLARSLARAHGGDIRYRRADTGGAEFVLTLPLAQGMSASSRSGVRSTQVRA
jgi:diguanylate cyclase (GGDEF)-like protein/PAS domain S-box-containing protein